jgi:hypothetical protein
MRVPVLRERSPIRGYTTPPPSRHPSPPPPQELETPTVGIVLAGEHTQIEDVNMAGQNLETPIEGISSPAAPQHPYNDHGLVGKTIWSFDYESYTDPKSKHVAYSEFGAAWTKEPMTPDSVQHCQSLVSCQSSNTKAMFCKHMFFAIPRYTKERSCEYKLSKRYLSTSTVSHSLRHTQFTI